MNFKMFLILYKFLKLKLRDIRGPEWNELEAELSENSAGFREYLETR